MGRVTRAFVVLSLFVVAALMGPEVSTAVTVPVGQTPYGVAVNPETNKIYVANYSPGTVSVIDGSTNTVVSTLAVGGDRLGWA